MELAGLVQDIHASAIGEWMRSSLKAMPIVESIHVLCAALVSVYVLMAVVEEPWLEEAYGPTYRQYRRRVPRFFNWHRGGVLAAVLMRRAHRLIRGRLGNAWAGPMVSTGLGRKH